MQNKKPFEFLHWPGCRAVLTALNGNALIVGGAVRNALLGMPVKDVDMATPLLPHDVIFALKAAGIKTISTGLKHGTVTAVFDRMSIEITTFRHDVETDGRHAKVRFSQSWQEDAMRRDFTINALYVNAAGQIYDYVNGQADLAKNLVRFIGDPTDRIREDALRIMRYFRMQAGYGSRIDRTSLKACVGQKEALVNLSSERVRAELFRLLLSPNPMPTVRLMQRYQILSPLGIYINDGKLLQRLIKREDRHNNPDALRRFAAFIDLNKSTKDLARVLKLSNIEGRRLKEMMAQILPEKINVENFKKATFKLHPQHLKDQIFLYKSNYYIKYLNTTIKKQNFPLKGEDIIQLGVKPSQKLGIFLRDAENFWLEQNFKPSRAELIQYIKDRL